MIGRRFTGRAVLVTIVATLASIVVAMLLVEVWVRATADPKQGSPGFFVADPVRMERLAPDYSGWFAGVPVQINHLGLRDSREYDLKKGPNTFRILVFGDSVTFGHGAIYETTYPFLLEQMLRKWSPQVDWQVWNAAVPGYNTSHELAQLLEVGPLFKPDLVIVGFFENDIDGNIVVVPATRRAVLTSRVTSWVNRHFYSMSWYRRIYLTLRWKWSRSDEYKARLERLAANESLLARAGQIQRLPQQQLTPFERLTDQQVAEFICDGGEQPSATVLADIQRNPGWPNWLRAVRDLQALHRSGAYRIVFFVNIAPPACPHGDQFYDGGSSAVNRFFLEGLGANGTPAVSVYDGFLHRRPSQMPLASGHSIGNSNLTKAETLFGYLTSEAGLLRDTAARQP